MKQPLILRWVCRNCLSRKSHLFDYEEFVDCCDINGIRIKVIIPCVLWRIDWCKLYTKRVIE